MFSTHRGGSECGGNIYSARPERVKEQADCTLQRLLGEGLTSSLKPTISFPVFTLSKGTIVHAPCSLAGCAGHKRFGGGKRGLRFLSPHLSVALGEPCYSCPGALALHKDFCLLSDTAWCWAPASSTQDAASPLTLDPDLMKCIHILPPQLYTRKLVLGNPSVVLGHSPQRGSGLLAGEGSRQYPCISYRLWFTSQEMGAFVANNLGVRVLWLVSA